MASESYESFPVVDGVMLPPFIDQNRVDEMKKFPLDKNDLFTVCYPKSGTTWLQQIVKLIRSGGKEDGSNITSAVPWLMIDKERFPETSGMFGGFNAADDSPLLPLRAFKAHVPYGMMPGGPPHTSPAKYIYIARNPKDVAVSYYHHYRSLAPISGYSLPWDDFFQRFMQGKVAYGLWFDHVLEWWKYKGCPNMLFLKYEDMKRDLTGAVKSISELMESNLSQEAVDSISEQTAFENMKDNRSANYSWLPESMRNSEGHSSFVRKGTVGQWKEYFTPKQSAEFDAEYADKLRGSDLDFAFE